jgi:hypothetical protein
MYQNMGEFTLIRNLKPGMKDLSIMFIVLEIGRPTKTKEGHEVRSVKIADRSGSINLSVWDDLGKLIQSGDIIRMTKGYVSVWKNCLTLYLGKTSEFQKVNEFCMVFSELPFMSEPNAELQNPNHERMSFQGGNKNFNRGNGTFPANNAANGAPGSKWGNNGPSGGPRTQPPPTSGPSSGSSGGGAPPTTNKSR